MNFFTLSAPVLSSVLIFVEIKFHLNENVECHCMQLELKSTQLDLNIIFISSTFGKINVLIETSNELNLVESNHIELNFVELNHIEFKLVESNPNQIEFSWVTERIE
jgi:hypothetical protein